MTLIFSIIVLFFVPLILYAGYLLLFMIGFFLPRKHYSSEKPNISVIIAARDEEHCITRCIHSICNQTFPVEKYEVIIANDQSEDTTPELIKALQKEYKNLKMINIESRPEEYAPKKYAINEALKISSGEIILTTDADITVKPTWIESIVSFFDNEVGLVVGFSSIRLNQVKKLFHKFEALDFLMLMTATKGSIRMGIPISCSGQNLSFRRSAFNEIGGFGEENKTQSADDVLLLHLMHNSNKWKISFADDTASFVETDAATSLKNFMKQRIRWAAMGIGQFTKSIHLTIINAATAITNIGLGILIVFYFLLPAVFLQYLIYAILAKFFIDFFIAFCGTKYFKKLSLLWFFPVLFIFYMPYILIISIFSLFGNFRWKERVYKKNIIKKF